jgi:phosphoribosyl 1,2-cyclic phosphodiesterase
MTDMGHTTEEALEWASQATTVVIESNYDMDMLLGGDYPQVLKDRISHGIGHLSNDACAEALPKILHPGLRNIFLCHLSGNNNTPELAYESARRALVDAGVEQGSIGLRVLRRGVASPLLTL